MNLKQHNLPVALLEAIIIVNTFSSPSIKDAGILLEAIEVGNEDDLYSSRDARNSTYTVSQYVSECVLIFQPGVSLPTRFRFARWNQIAGMVALTQSSVKFWGASFTKSSHSTSGFSPQAIFKEGIDKSPFSGSSIST